VFQVPQHVFVTDGFLGSAFLGEANVLLPGSVRQANSLGFWNAVGQSQV
jgi:hypothetical protein